MEYLEETFEIPSPCVVVEALGVYWFPVWKNYILCARWWKALGWLTGPSRRSGKKKKKVYYRRRSCVSGIGLGGEG